MVDRRIEEVVVVHRDGDGKSLGQIFFHVIDERETVIDDLGCVGAGRLEHDGRNTRATVVAAMETVGHTSELYCGYVFETKHLSVIFSADNDVFEFFRRYKTALVAHDVLECLFSLFAERTGSSFDVLLGKSR